MRATAELQVIPLGAGVSVRTEVARIVGLLGDYDFILETHAAGTNIEGDLDTILEAVAHIHKDMHTSGDQKNTFRPLKMSTGRWVHSWKN